MIQCKFMATTLIVSELNVSTARIFSLNVSTIFSLEAPHLLARPDLNASETNVKQISTSVALNEAAPLFVLGTLFQTCALFVPKTKHI